MFTRSRENFIHFYEPKRIAITDAHQIESTRRVSVGLNYTNIEPIKMKTFFKYKLYQVNFLLPGTAIWLQNNFILFTLFNFWRPISS
jgi:hypothetical protein